MPMSSFIYFNSQSVKNMFVFSVYDVLLYLQISKVGIMAAYLKGKLNGGPFSLVLTTKTNSFCQFCSRMPKRKQLNANPIMIPATSLRPTV